MTLVHSLFNANKEGWKKSFIAGFSQDKNGAAVPWMSYPAIEFLQNFLNKDQTVFEFGCGASTLFFAKKVKKVVSLETNSRWAEIVSQKLVDEGLSNVEINLMLDGLTNTAYENFAQNYEEKFDIIVIDSLKRFNCAKNCITALKLGGTIILDDSERENYRKIFTLFADLGFNREDFFGIAPGQLRIKNTSFFRSNETG